MKTNFFGLIGSLARRMVAEPVFADNLPLLGIDPKTWPESKAKTIALQYLAEREKGGHSFAQHKLASETFGIPVWENTPHEMEALRGIYAEQAQAFRAQHFAMQLRDISDPKVIEKLATEFLYGRGEAVETVNLIEYFSERVQEVEREAKDGTAVVKISAWPVLSNAIGGFNPGRVALIVADTGFGKTNLSAALARSAARDAPTLFVNMEMTKKDIADKFIMGETSTSYSKYKAGLTEVQSLIKMANEYMGKDDKAPLRLVFTTGKALTAEEIVSVARAEAAKGMKFMFVDYDQKVVLHTSREIQEWKALLMFVEKMEQVAKELGIWIGILSQGNEEGDPTASKRSKQPTSVVLRFHKIDDDFVCTAVKNRFGMRNASVRINYQPERAFAHEDGPYHRKEKANGFAPRPRGPSAPADFKRRFPGDD